MMRRRSFLRTLAAATAGLIVKPSLAWERPRPYFPDLKALIAAAIAEHDRRIEEAFSSAARTSSLASRSRSSWTTGLIRRTKENSCHEPHLS